MSSASFRPRLNAQIREEASEWLISFCEGEGDTAAREKFTGWLKTSPQHVRAYLRVSAFWDDGELIDKDGKGDIDALVQRALAESNVVALPAATGLCEVNAANEQAAHLLPLQHQEKPATSISPQRRGANAVVFLVACIGAALFTWLQFYSAPTYTTAIGETRTVTLSDGSLVELNARSAIKVKFSESQRVVDLLEGQALFRVARNPARPFVVRSGDTSVKAVGTQFDVYRKSSGTLVTVLEGRVAISEPAHPRPGGAGTAVEEPVLLKAGEQAVVTSQAIVSSKNANLAAATAWTEGLLMFDAAPLSEVVEEFNRHNIRPLVLEDARLRNLRISGIFPATGAERIVQFLRERFGVAVRETDEDIRISTG